MFSKVAVFVSALFIASAVATPIENSCNSSGVRCCQTLNAPNSAEGTALLGLVDVALQSFSGQVGFQCNPISVIGVGAGANCASQPVCCENVTTNQLIGVNCSPITVGA